MDQLTSLHKAGFFSYESGDYSAFNSCINKKVTVSISVTNGSTTTLSKKVDYNTEATFTVTPDSGYVFDSVVCSDETNTVTSTYDSSTKTLSLTPTKDTNCTINFIESTYLKDIILANNTLNEDISNFYYEADGFKEDLTVNITSSEGFCVTSSIDNIEINEPVFKHMVNSTCDIKDIQNYIGYFTLGYNDYIGTTGTYVYKIKEGNGTTITKVDKLKMKVKEGQGLVKTEDDDGATYIFRGIIDNNYVSFAGNLWRIVRINGDGTIRLITDESIGNSAYKDYSSYNAMYVGYTYNNGTKCTVSNPCTGQTGEYSDVKNYLENWYQNNLINYDSQIAISAYCNDTTLETNGYYGVYNRINNIDKYPSLKCSDTGQTYGGYYKLKVGLINVDEMMYSGLNWWNGNPTTMYLSKDYDWLSMSPISSNHTNCDIFINIQSGDYIEIGGLNNQYAIRPVINLNADVTVINGDGSVNNPFVIE